MEINQSNDLPVPWTTKDVWLGVVGLAGWWVIFLLVIFVSETINLQVNIGLAMGFWELTLIVPIWWFSLRKYGGKWNQLGLRSFKGEMMALGCGLIIFSFGFNLIYNLFLNLFGLRAQADLIPIFEELSSPWWLLVTGIVIAPIIEEIVFRGFIFAGFKQRYGWLNAALISSGLFAALHLQPLAMLPIFILGFIFAYLYHQSKSIWPGIILHVSSNAIALGSAYVLVKLGYGV